MAAYDWGIDDQPHAISAEYSGRSKMEPEHLPEVRRLAEQGWTLAPGAPAWAFLPSIWPRRLRTWVPDRAARYEQRWLMNGSDRVMSAETVPWSDSMYDEEEADINRLLRRAGVPPRPARRLWLLKQPAGYQSLEAFLNHVIQQAMRAGFGFECSAQFISYTTRMLAEAGAGDV